MISRAYRSALLFAAACLTSGVLFGAAASAGHWKFREYTFDPTQSFYDGVRKGTPAPHVYEVRVSGAFWGSAQAHGTVDAFFKTDDADLKVTIAQGHCNLAIDNASDKLAPGQKVHLRSDAAMTQSGFPGASGECAIWIDNGDYLLVLNTAHSRPASGEADAVIPGGGPGAVMVVHVRFGLAQNGAIHPRLDGIYDWVP